MTMSSLSASPDQRTRTRQPFGEAKLYDDDLPVDVFTYSATVKALTVPPASISDHLTANLHRVVTGNSALTAGLCSNLRLRDSHRFLELRTCSRGDLRLVGECAIQSL